MMLGVKSVEDSYQRLFETMDDERSWCDERLSMHSRYEMVGNKQIHWSNDAKDGPATCTKGLVQISLALTQAHCS